MRNRSPPEGIRSPALVHDGRPAGGAFDSCLTLRLPSETISTFHAVPTGRTKASCFPSGDQAGYESRTPLVRRRRPPPSRSIVKMPTPTRAKAMRLPFGEKAGAIAGYAPLVSCLRPVPGAPEEKNLAKNFPSGVAENPIGPPVATGGAGAAVTSINAATA